MKTHEFIEEMQEIGYTVTENYYYIDVTCFWLGRMELVAQISTKQTNKLNTLLDEYNQLTEDASKLLYTYSQTPIKEREADYYHLKTDYDITGRNDYVYSIYSLPSVYGTAPTKRITFTGAKDDAEQYSRKEAIELANEYPYLELVGIE